MFMDTLSQRRLASGGHIYRGKYEGWYSMTEEVFVTEEEVRWCISFDVLFFFMYYYIVVIVVVVILVFVSTVVVVVIVLANIVVIDPAIIVAIVSTILLLLLELLLLFIFLLLTVLLLSNRLQLLKILDRVLSGHPKITIFFV